MKRPIIFIAFIAFIASITISITTCSIFDDGDEDITLSLDKSDITMNIGDMDILNLEISEGQNSKSVRWTYDENIVSAKADSYGVVVTALSAGTTTVTADYKGKKAFCNIIVTNGTHQTYITNPYVYTSDDYISVTPGSKKRICASLYGGTNADINGFQWTIDKPSIASLAVEGNYCWVTGIGEGFAKINVRHTKCAYGYSVLVNCAVDNKTVPYITTKSNVITINKDEVDEKTGDNKYQVEVKLEKPLTENFLNKFTYELTDENGNPISDTNAPAIIFSQTLNMCVLQPKKVGNCYLKVHHPEAIYDLDILICVTENMSNAFIAPSLTIVNLQGNNSEIVTINIDGYNEDINPDLFTWEISEDAKNHIDYSIFNGSSNGKGDKIRITGKKTGSAKITIGYPGLNKRNIIAVVKDISTEASYADTFITTSQNYIKTSLEDEPTQIYVTLKNCKEGDTNSLLWNIVSSPTDGSNDSVVEWTSGVGRHTSSIASRGAFVLSYNEDASATITPLKEGTAYIDISHPRAIYSTRINIVVTAKKEVVVSDKAYLSLNSSPVINIKNGEEGSVTVNISGNGKAKDIVWTKTGDGNCTIASNENICVITAPVTNSGVSQNTLTATHPKADYPVTYTINFYDTDEELTNIQNNQAFFIYTTNSHYTFNLNETNSLQVIREGKAKVIQNGDDTILEYPKISWAITAGKDIINIENTNDDSTLNITGVKVGEALVTATAEGCTPVIFQITIENMNIVDPNLPSYLSTQDNIVYFETANEKKDIEIIAHNISNFALDQMEWSCSNKDFEIDANANKATIIALKPVATATLSVTHPLAQNNPLTIELRTGNRFEYKTKDACFITANKDTFELYQGQDSVQLIAKLNHTAQNENPDEEKDFAFTSDNENIATIQYVNGSNVCEISPKTLGTTTVIITNSHADFEKEVVIIVKSAPDMEGIPYITTENNVITLLQGENAVAQMELVNCESINNDYWSWSIKNNNTANIVSHTGGTAIISGISPGTTEITVSHKTDNVKTNCPYSMKIIVICLANDNNATEPYILASENIITLQKGDTGSLTALIKNGDPSDNTSFSWSVSNPNILLINPSANSCYIKGLGKGITYISVKNTKYPNAYTKTILVIVEQDAIEGCYITVDNQIIQIKPDETEPIKITAALVKGEPTDAQDFIWWVDDYKIVNITPIADACSVEPTGRSGTTKIHIKHAKAKKQVDILVMVSNYDTFAFEESSTTITTGNLTFYPLQVPAVEEEYEIVYESESSDICTVTGTNSVAMLCGQVQGNVNVTAKMISTDKKVLATATMLVHVQQKDENKPVISINKFILNINETETETLNATITGDGIKKSDEYKLRWTILEAKKGSPINGIRIMTETDETGKAFDYVEGAHCKIDAKLKGEYVIKCEHKESGTSATVCIVVEEKGEQMIILDEYFKEIFINDGAFDITAEVKNGTTDDENALAWSAVKVGGANIVQVSKTGKVCNVVPVNIGVTTVIARLPNGKTARCEVAIKPAAEVKLETRTVHTLPGYTQIINYTTNPIDEHIDAIVQYYGSATVQSGGADGTDGRTFRVENDEINRQLRIIGLKPYQNGAAGEISLSMKGSIPTEMPRIKVYCQYDMRIECEDIDENGIVGERINNNGIIDNIICGDQNCNCGYPKEKKLSLPEKKIRLRYYPKDMNIIVNCNSNARGEDAYSIKAESGSIVKVAKKEYETELQADGTIAGLMTVTFTPIQEGEQPITVYATLPNNTGDASRISSNFILKQFYEHGYTIEVNYNDFPVGALSKIDENGISLSDGEAVWFYFDVKNKGVPTDIIQDMKAVYNYSGKKNEYKQTNDINFKNGNNIHRQTKKRLLFGNQCKGLDYTDTSTFDDKRKKTYEEQNITFLEANLKVGGNNGTLADTDEGAGAINFGTVKVDGSDKTWYKLEHYWDWYTDVPIYSEYSQYAWSGADNGYAGRDKNNNYKLINGYWLRDEGNFYASYPFENFIITKEMMYNLKNNSINAYDIIFSYNYPVWRTEGWDGSESSGDSSGEPTHFISYIQSGITIDILKKNDPYYHLLIITEKDPRKYGTGYEGSFCNIANSTHWTYEQNILRKLEPETTKNNFTPDKSKIIYYHSLKAPYIISRTILLPSNKHYDTSNPSNVFSHFVHKSGYDLLQELDKEKSYFSNHNSNGFLLSNEREKISENLYSGNFEIHAKLLHAYAKPYPSIDTTDVLQSKNGNNDFKAKITFDYPMAINKNESHSHKGINITFARRYSKAYENYQSKYENGVNKYYIVSDNNQ